MTQLNAGEMGFVKVSLSDQTSGNSLLKVDFFLHLNCSLFAILLYRSRSEVNMATRRLGTRDINVRLKPFD